MEATKRRTWINLGCKLDQPGNNHGAAEQIVAAESRWPAIVRDSDRKNRRPDPPNNPFPPAADYYLTLTYPLVALAKVCVPANMQIPFEKFPFRTIPVNEPSYFTLASAVSLFSKRS